MTEPGLTIAAAHYSAGNLPVDRYVVHTTSPLIGGFPDSSAVGNAIGTAWYFADWACQGSAHYVHDAGGMRTEQHCVWEGDQAWHAPPNQHSIGDEIAGQPWYSRSQWLDPRVWAAVDASARRCADVCVRHGIPIVKLSVTDLRAGHRGICGHWEVAAAFGLSDHYDPGPNFPWDRYLAAVGAYAHPKPPPDFLEELMAALTDAEKHQYLDDVHSIRGTLETMNQRAFQERQAGGWDDPVLRAILAALNPAGVAPPPPPPEEDPT